MRNRFAFWCSILWLALLPACANFNELTGPTLVPGVVATVEVPTTQTQLSVGGTLALQARVRDGNGNNVVDRTVLWTSSDTKIALVSAEGLVTGVDTGTVRIAVSVQGRSAVTTLRVMPRAVASIMVNPPSPNILVGGQLQLASTTLGESGDVLAGRSVFWQSSNPLVAAIDNTGLLTGLSAGVTTITATSESRSATVGVTVLPVPVATVQISPAVDTVVVGQTTQLTASPRDSIGTPLSDRPIGWSSSNGAVATVSASGLVVGAQAGTVTITGSSEGKTGTSRIVVLSRPVGSVIVSPSQVAIVVGQTLKLSVVITDDNGTLLTGRPIAYSSGNTSVAQVESDGTVSGIKEGSTNITVASEGRVGVASVIVSASPIASIRINSTSLELAIGASQKLTATLLDAGSNPLPARPIVWSSGAPSIATVTADGTVTALAAGTVVIFANVDGKLASVSLTVRAITVASVLVAPAASNLFVGDLLDLGAQPRDATGTVVAGRVVQWSTGDPLIAIVSSAGRVRAMGAGQVLITATVDGITGSSAITVTVEPVLTITANPALLNLLPLATATIVPTARGRNGVPLSGRTFTFVSSDQAIATVSSIGVVSAIKTGKANIVISSEGKSVTVPVEVALAPVATVVVTLPNATRLVGQTMQATAETRDAQSNLLSGRPVVWSSSDANVASVSASGVVTALSPGTARITAASEGKSGFGTVTVSLVPVATVAVTLAQTARHIGETTQATAVTRDSVGGLLTGRTIVWTTSNANVATVSSSGLVTAVGAGSANIIATSEGKSNNATVTVTPVPVAKVVVTLANPSRFVLQQTQATAVLTDANNNVLTGRVITWTSSNALVASVSPTGLVTALLPGTADITATSETIVGKATITVGLAPVATIAVTLANPSRFVGQTTQATAVLRDAGGNILTGRTIVWSSADLTVATVSSSGLVTAVAPGTKNIIATSEGINGTAPLTVALVPVSTVSVTAPLTGLQPGQTTQATAVPRDSVNGALTGRTITWQSSNNAAATVSTTGLIAAVAPGNATITATSEGKSGTVAIAVTFVPVSTVAVTLDKPQVFVSYTAQATAVTRDASNNILTGRQISWQSSNSAVATVAGDGVVTAVGPGTAFIIGTSEGKTGNATVAVTVAPVASVALSVASTTLLVGQTTQADVSLSDANGKPLTNRLIVYSSTNPNIVSVTQGGVIRGVSAGTANIDAESEGKGATVSIRVTEIPVQQVTVKLTGTGTDVPVGTTRQAQAEARDAGGNLLTGRAVSWSSSDPSLASVDALGSVLGKKVGDVAISATIEGKSGQITVNVIPAAVATVAITLASPTIQILQSTQATVVLRDASNNVLTGRAITYSSANPLVAIVSASGVVQALLPGTSNITATSEGKSSSALLTVTLVPVNTVDVSLASSTLTAGATTQATAVTRDVLNNVLSGRAIAWSSSNGAVATVNANGLVTSISAGTANITATSEGKSDFATLTVNPPPVATVAVSLTASNVIVGATPQASAVLRDANNNVLTGRTIAWSSSNASVATVNSSGLVTTHAAGTTNITATSEGKSDFEVLTVTVPPVATVAVSLTATTVVAGATSQASAVLRDAGNNILTGRTIVWSSSNPSVATVNSSGLVTSLAAGTTNIIATSETKTGQATLTVNAPAPAPVATVTVSLTSTSVVVGGTTQASAVLRDASNNALTGRTIAWSSTNTAVATVNSSGLVTTLAAGTTNITATSEGKSDFDVLTVTVPPVSTVTVSLTATSVVAGATSQASAVLRDASNNVLTGRTIVWTSSSPSVATVNSSTGLVTTLTAGTTNIIATSETKTGQAALTVLAAVNTVTVSLTATNVVAGATSQASAVLRDASNNVLTGRTIVWSSSNQSVATVNASTGLVTSLAAGTTNIIATSETKTGQATLTVTAPIVPVNTVIVSLTATSVVVGGTTQASAVLRDASNNVLTGRTIAWSSTNTSVATVDVNGLVTTLAAGTSNITATSEGKTDFEQLTVTVPPVSTVTVSLTATSVVAGATSQASAVLRDASNNVLTGRTIVWSSSNQSVATVNASTGLVTSLAAGTTNIIATSETKTGQATLTVLAPVNTVTVSLTATTVVAGGTSQASAVLRDASNNVLTGRTIVWSSSNQSVATVNASTGLVTSLAAGTTNIIATSETKTGQAALTVTAPVAPVNTVTVSLTATTVVVGGTTQASAVLRDASNNVLTGRTIVWSSSNQSVATVNASTGLVTSLAAGTTNIIATSETKTGQAALTVTAPPAPVATVVVSLTATSVVVGGTSQASAVLRDAGNNVLTGRTIAWSSTNTSVATVDVNGLVTTLAAGTSNITATSEGKTDFEVLTVTVPPVSTVTVSLTATNVVAGATSQASAVLRDASNNVLSGRTIVWSSSNQSVATVNSSTGLVTTLTAGTTNIIATSETKTGQAALTVLAAVNTVTVSLTATSVVAGGASQASAVLRDAGNNVLTGRTIVWSSSNQSVATVNSSTGLVTTLAAGTTNIIATSETKTGQAALTVLAPVALVAVGVSPSPAIAGQTAQATAVLRDANNNVLTGRTIAWSSSNQTVATVDATGLVTALTSGNTNIIATSEGKTGQTALSVLPAVATVSVSLTATSVNVGATSQATATTRDASNVLLSGRPVTWSSSNPAVATVNSSGLVTALSAGSSNIIATSEGKTGQATITVTTFD